MQIILKIFHELSYFMLYDHSVRVIHEFDISHRGQGSLIVFGEDLSSGVYTYSLIIDGENHKTKRMVKQYFIF